jgi:thiamine-phosphate pyrophosphorylase
MKKNNDYLLYLVSDFGFEGTLNIYEQVEIAIQNGVTMLQFRAKDISDEDFLKSAIKLREITKKYNVPLVINDKVDVAIKCLADGVHLGRNDMSIEEARKKLGEDIFIGSSVATIEEALQAQKKGANYVGVGAMFNTTTKDNTRSVSSKTLKDICSILDIPVVAIGGINAVNMHELSACNVNGIAVVSAILAKEDIAKATLELRNNCESIFKSK